MPASSFDVLSIGNAIVDVIRRCDDTFIAQLGGRKGTMTLVPSSQVITTICSRLRPGIEVAGGGATNLAVGLTSLGGRAAYIGRVAEDEFGRIFRHDLRSAGVSFQSLPTVIAGKETARSLILVTPDGVRTMYTYLGCAPDIDHGMINGAAVKQAKVAFLEGYLMDHPDAKSAMERAQSVARSSGVRVAIALSDAHCVKRHRRDFLQYISHGVNVVFANEHEVKALYETESIDDAIAHLGRDVEIGVVTRGARGSLILAGGKCAVVEAERVDKVVDQTGAGELYAAGFLYGLCRGMDLAAAGRLGSFAAADIVRIVGARPETKLGHLARMRGLIH